MWRKIGLHTIRCGLTSDRSVGRVPQKQLGVISPDYVVFSCSERILPGLLFKFLKHGKGLHAINGVTAGSVRERLYFDKLGLIEFPLPPMQEQRRLLARIDELTDKINEARKLRVEAANKWKNCTLQSSRPTTRRSQLQCESW